MARKTEPQPAPPPPAPAPLPVAAPHYMFAPVTTAPPATAPAPDPRLAQAIALLRGLVGPCEDVIARDPAWPGRPLIDQAKTLLLTE